MSHKQIYTFDSPDDLKNFAEREALRDASDAALEELTGKVRLLAQGKEPLPVTTEDRDTLLKELCEVVSRLWFEDRYDES